MRAFVGALLTLMIGVLAGRAMAQGDVGPPLESSKVTVTGDRIDYEIPYSTYLTMREQPGDQFVLISFVATNTDGKSWRGRIQVPETALGPDGGTPTPFSTVGLESGISVPDKGIGTIGSSQTVELPSTTEIVTKKVIGSLSPTTASCDFTPTDDVSMGMLAPEEGPARTTSVVVGFTLHRIAPITFDRTPEVPLSSFTAPAAPSSVNIPFWSTPVAVGTCCNGGMMGGGGGGD